MDVVPLTPEQLANPGFALVANDKDITDSILARFKSLRYTDETGVATDLLEVELSDTDDSAPMALPPTGAELKLSLGYGGQLRSMGTFVCSEIELEGPPDSMRITARSAAYDQTPKGVSDLQTHKNRTWKAGTTIGALVAKMAKEHGMKSAVSPALASVQLPLLHQSEESDINLLLRLGKRYDAIAKPAGGMLVFAKRGDSKTVSGVALPSLKLTRSDCSKWRLNQTTRESAGTVVAYYHANRSAKRHEVTVGSGEPVKRLKMYFVNQEQALAAAKAELARRARGEFKLWLRLPGRNDAIAEAELNLTGFRDAYNGDWVVTLAEHELTSNGWVCELNAERPNSNAEVQQLAGKAATGDVS